MKPEIQQTIQPPTLWTYRLTDTEIKKCQDFAPLCYESNKDCYDDRGQLVREECIRQISQGKETEIGIHHLLTQHDIQSTEPDFEVVSKEKKKFGSDLILTLAPDVRAHVKSQGTNMISCFGTSWLFNKDRDPALYARKPGTDFVFFASVNHDTKEVYLRALVDAYWLNTCGLFELPVKNNLKASKWAVYSDTLIKSLDASQRFCIETLKESIARSKT